MKDKLIKLLFGTAIHWSYEYSDEDFLKDAERTADYLIANGVTVQTTPIPYDRLLKLASKMHTWIFLNTGDEQKVYDELGITEEDNYVFGYGGRVEMHLPVAPKEVE